MAIGKNHFKNLFKKMNINVNDGGVSVNINMTRFGIKLDKAQDALKEQFLLQMLEHVPGEDGGQLRQDIKMFNENNGERDVVYAYNPSGVEYSHYQHEGILYVDPITKKGAFYNLEYGFWNRPLEKGGTKEPSNRLLHYKNPNAKRDWARYTAEHDKNTIVDAAKEEFRK